MADIYKTGGEVVAIMVNKTYNELRGKREGQINWHIRKIKADIRRVINELEIPRWDVCEEKSEEIKNLAKENLKSLKEKLTLAIKALEDSGYEYHLDRVAQRITEFNEELEVLSEVVLKYGCAETGYKTIKAEIDKSIVKLTLSENFLECKISTIDKTEFINALKNLSIGEWKRNYDLSEYGYCYLDGESWCLTFYFLNGESKVFGGKSIYPYNFNGLLSLMGVENKLL